MSSMRFGHNFYTGFSDDCQVSGVKFAGSEQMHHAVGQEGKGGAVFIGQDFIADNSDVKFESCAAKQGQCCRR